MISCSSGKKKDNTQKAANNNEALIKINKYLVDKDADQIRGFVRRRNWNMKTTQTGLWYMIERKGTGEAAHTGMIATINYTVSLLDGTICYSSDKPGPKKFRIGKGGVERGLEEGILLLHKGDKAVFILPPHLAFGLTGDDNKIPPRSIIVYEVELLQLSE
jgi:FKBP-type peptidyl-prolyl cis-trans isomerase